MTDASRGLDLLRSFSTESRLTRVILVAFLVSRGFAVAYAIGQVGFPLLNWFAFAIFIAITFTAFRPRPLSRLDLAALLFGFTSVSLMVESVLPLGEQDPLGWHYVGFTIVAFGLALRGHQITALVGYLLVLAIGAIVPTVILGVEPALTFDSRVRNVIIIVIAAVASAVLAWMDRRFYQTWRDTGIRRAQGEALTEASRMRRQRLVQVIGQSEAVLDEIASGRPLDARLLQESAILEASLRDGIRGRRMATGRLVASAEAARRRGVTVVILDDGPTEIDPGRITRAVEWAATLVDQLPRGKAVIRLLPGNQRDTATCVFTPPLDSEAPDDSEPMMYVLPGPDTPRRLRRHERSLREPKH